MRSARFGLIGNHYSTSLCLIKRAAEDRGIRAIFCSPLAFPRYALSTIAQEGIELDHIKLLDFDCFYIDILDHRNGFFRGYFGKDIWISLQQRYQDFAKEEMENKSYQLLLLLLLSDLRPCVNHPKRLLLTRLRPTTLFNLRRNGIPVADFRITSNGSSQVEERAGAGLARIRIEEERCYDVPCFPRTLRGCLSVETTTPEQTWEVVSVIGYEGKSIIERGDSARIRRPKPDDIREICQDVLSTLGLDVASIKFAREKGDLKVFDVNPFPDIATFEEATGEPISEAIVDRMIERSGIK